MKKVLVIYKPYKSNISIGIRHLSIINFLSKKTNLTTLPFQYEPNRIKISLNILKKKNFISLLKKVYLKAYSFPDIYNYYIKYFKKELYLKIKQKNYKTVLILIKPFSLIKIAKIIKKKYHNINIVIDTSDPFLKNVGYQNTNIIKKLRIKYFEFIHLKYVNTLIVLNKEGKEYYSKYVEKIIIIEQGVNDKIINYNKSNTIKKTNKFKLIYGGVFYKHLREPFELYKSIICFESDIKLSIYSRSPKYFHPPVHERISYKKPIKQDELFNQYLNCDIIVFIDNFVGIQVPGKIIEILVFNKPILFIYENEDSPSINYIKNYEGIYMVKNNHKKISETISTIISEYPKQINRDIGKYYWRSILKKLYHVI